MNLREGCMGAHCTHSAMLSNSEHLKPKQLEGNRHLEPASQNAFGVPVLGHVRIPAQRALSMRAFLYLIPASVFALEYLR